MTDLVWVGNTLVERWFALIGIAMTIILACLLVWGLWLLFVLIVGRLTRH
jgi:hypothetical protein